MTEETPKPVAKPTIAEIEAMLNQDDEVEIEILPNGEVRVKGHSGETVPKPLTMRDNLGGEY